MKNIIKLICLFIVFTGIACAAKSGDEKSVRSIAVSYLSAFQNFDFNEAKKYGTADAAIFLDQMQQYVDQRTPEERLAAKENVKNIVIRLGDVKIKADRAKITYKFEEKNKYVMTETLYLIRQDGNWKVQEFPDPTQPHDELFDF